MDKTKKLLMLRALIEALTAEMADDEIWQCPELVERWKVGEAYEVGKRVSYGGTVYKVLQAHTSQEAWTPDAAPSLFAKVLNPDGQIPEWEQPDSTNGYSKGDRVRYKGKTYESLIDNNVWAPDAYPAGWKEV